MRCPRIQQQSATPTPTPAPAPAPAPAAPAPHVAHGSAGSSSLPAGWKMGECKAGDECFVNTVTGQKFYDLPHTKAAAEELVLPAGWSLTTSNSTGVTYYVKPVRGAR